MRTLFGHTSSEVVIKALEGVSDERQAHLGALLLRRRHLAASSTSSLLGSLEQSSVVCLVDLVRREVRGVDGRRQARLERCSDPAQAFELDTSEEGMALDLVCAAPAETVLRVADQARREW